MSELLSSPDWVPHPEGVVAVCTRLDDSLHVVELSGELDLASRAAALHACARPEHLHVRVDLTGLTFMDCAGYRALVVATSTLAHRGGSTVLINPVGEPRRLLTVIEELERGLCAPCELGR